MKIHEYQAKRLFAAYEIPVPAGGPAFNAWEAYETARRIGGETFVVKAQIHAGGRGKAGSRATASHTASMAGSQKLWQE